jgi:hypothetical protein
MATTNKVFNKTISNGEQKKELHLGFFGYNANRIFDVFANHSKIGKEKMAVSSTQFGYLMDAIDNINAANRTVVEVTGGRRLDDLNFFDKLKDAFFAPRDVRFTESALLSRNLVVTSNDTVIDTKLNWAEFNDIVGYLSEKASQKDSLSYSAMGREAIHGKMEMLEKRMLIVTEGRDNPKFKFENVKFYVPREADKLLAPVMVTPGVASLLYNQNRFITDVDEFCDEYIEGLRILFDGK